MVDKLSINLLKLLKSGKVEIKQNSKKSLQFTADQNTVTINLIDVSFGVPTSKGVFTRLSEARQFASELKKQNLTLSISHKNKPVMKLGKDAKPKLSMMVTRSSAVEITNLRELRKLDKRLRLK